MMMKLLRQQQYFVDIIKIRFLTYTRYIDYIINVSFFLSFFFFFVLFLVRGTFGNFVVDRKDTNYF